jgi:hypothetical protein
VATSPTPTITLNKATLKIQVLNGTEGKGVAAKARDALTAAGYSEISVGNAETSDYELTVISIKPSKKAYLDGLKKDLEEAKYNLESETDNLTEGNEFDAIVVIGSK